MASPTDSFEIADAPVVAPTETCAAAQAKTESAKPDFKVTDDLPRPLPVMPKEADVVEMFLAALLDDVLGKSRISARRTSSAP